MLHDSQPPVPDETAPAADASRRGFLTQAVRASALPAMLAAGAPALADGRIFKSSGGSGGITAAARRPAPAPKKKIAGKLPSLYPNWLPKYFQEIQNDENTHVDFLVNALGSAARPKPTFQNLATNNLNTFAQMSQTFENTGVSAYLAALPVIFNHDYVQPAASIALVEAYHSGFLNTLVNADMIPGGVSFAQPSPSPDSVVNAVSGFIASLNGGPAPTFSATPSAANDIDILNFALLLEYLEAEFYNTNVPYLFS